MIIAQAIADKKFIRPVRAVCVGVCLACTQVPGRSPPAPTPSNHAKPMTTDIGATKCALSEYDIKSESAMEGAAVGVKRGENYGYIRVLRITELSISIKFGVIRLVNMCKM